MKLLDLVLVDRNWSLVEYTPNEDGCRQVLSVGETLALDTEKTLREMISATNTARARLQGRRSNPGDDE